MQIRASTKEDWAELDRLYSRAFPEEDLVPLVRKMLTGRYEFLSLVAVEGDRPIGHIGFTTCCLSSGDLRIALLAPLAVDPDRQRNGIGSALVREGLLRLEHAGIDAVCTLGDPAYYGRFGFVEERDIAPPHALPAEWRPAWQALQPGGAKVRITGRLIVPEPWQDKALWLPPEA